MNYTELSIPEMSRSRVGRSVHDYGVGEIVSISGSYLKHRLNSCATFLTVLQ